MMDSTLTIDIGRLTRRLILVGLALSLSACQVWDQLRPVQDSPPAEVEPTVEPPPPIEQAVPQALPPATLQQVIDALDRGRLDEAETALLSIIDKRPNSTLALRFLEQLQSDPLELMGEAHDTVIVQPGDSLSAIAQREFGDAMQFFALARYNGIAAPRRMAPGIELKIPRSLKQASSADSAVTEPMPMVELEPEVELPPGAGLTLAGRRLVEAGRLTQAIALLSAGAEAQNLDAAGEQLLARAAIRRSEVLIAEGRQDDAMTLLNEVSEHLSSAGRPLLDPGRDLLQAQQLMEEGIRARRAGDLSAALTSFETALRLDPANSDIEAEAANVRGVLVAQLHDRALVHYRDQELDSAISLWQQVQALAPEFEPAQVYLERALALRERLEQLD